MDITPHVTQLFYVNGSFRRNGRHARTLNKILHSKEDAESHYKTGLFVITSGHVDEGMVWIKRENNIISLGSSRWLKFHEQSRATKRSRIHQNVSTLKWKQCCMTAWGQHINSFTFTKLHHKTKTWKTPTLCTVSLLGYLYQFKLLLNTAFSSL